MKKKRLSKFKSAAIGFTAIAMSLCIGLTAACSSNSNSSTDDDDDDNAKTKQDLQDIKNGNFEFYDDNDGLYPISSPNNWSSGTDGNSSASMSGIIKTDKAGWDYLTDPDLPQTLEDNDDLDDDDDNKKDYGGALTDDMLYKNSHDDEDDREYISNPYTHAYSYNENGDVLDKDGNKVTTYSDDDGKLYLDEELKTPLETSVLMIHNYRKNYFTGTETYYASSTTISLEANTACKISVWVKTSDLYVDDSSGERSAVTCDRGAYIKVDSNVGGNSVDSFMIKNINTEQLNKGKLQVENNGWIQYTVYVEASSFATTTVTLTLGLGENGENGVYTVEGYAFFDDITFEKYLNLDELKEKNTTFDEDIRTADTSTSARNTAFPLEPDAETTFRVDTFTGTTNSKDNPASSQVQTNTYNSADTSFFIDFASSTTATGVELKSGNVSGGLTVEKTTTGKYISSKNSTSSLLKNVTALENGAANAYLSSNLKYNNGFDISEDFIATVSILDGSWTFPVTTELGTLLTSKLKSAVNLPGAGDSTTALVMASMWGAPYEAVISDDSFVISDDGYALISFWVKTSDFDGNTAMTVTAVDANDDANSANFTVDSTTMSTTDIGDNEDVYDGWVQCFVKVSNTSAETTDKQFKLKINLGTTTIKGMTYTDGYKGWVALTNLSIMNLDEDVYSYTSDLSNSAELTFTEATETTLDVFDSEQGSNNAIKSDLAIPSSYTGTYSKVVDTDKFTNDYSGLLNKENLDSYKDKGWYNELNTLVGLSGLTNEEIWNKVVGEYSVQPLLIVNTVKAFDDATKIYNYGYYKTSTSTVSADSYSAISVRVKASAGAIAAVYLVDADDNVITYETPKYNFWYDDNGNILKGEIDEDATKEEKTANIAYKLREDGLYEKNENSDGTLYANLYNLTKYYDVRYEQEEFYDESGNLVAYQNLVTGNTYYANKDKTAYAPHHLVASENGNYKVYEYAEGIGDNATYYYMEDGVANKSKVVHGLDTSIAQIRYENLPTSEHMFVIDTTTAEGAKYADKWVTITFNIHTGASELEYRLELWSGYRGEASSYTSTDTSYVLFDYSSYSIDSSTYSERLTYYTNEIIAEYKEQLTSELPDNDQNISALEELAGAELTATVKAKMFNYSAMYYTFSLYDTSAFIPFNGETSDDSGYSYVYSDYSESLAYFTVEDATDENDIHFTAFADYSVVDKDIEIIGKPTVDDDDDDDDDNTTSSSDTNVWMLVASIALVVAILIALIAMIVTPLIKKFRGRKRAGKNTYNFKKNKRYVRKYVKANGEVAEGGAEENADTTTAGEAAEAPTEAESTEAGETAESAEAGETAETSEAAEATETGDGADESTEKKDSGDGDDKK